MTKNAKEFGLIRNFIVLDNSLIINDLRKLEMHCDKLFVSTYPAGRVN